MENLDNPEQTGGGAPATPPAPGQVVLTQEQYAELQRKASGGGWSGMTPEGAAAADPRAPKYSRVFMDYVGLGFVVLLVATFLLPGFGLLGFPLVIFGVLAALEFFRTSKLRAPGQRVNPAIMIFKILAGIALSILIAIGGFVAFIIILFSTTDTRGT
jgi:hypothetical protein